MVNICKAAISVLVKYPLLHIFEQHMVLFFAQANGFVCPFARGDVAEKHSKLACFGRIGINIIKLIRGGIVFFKFLGNTCCNNTSVVFKPHLFNVGHYLPDSPSDYEF